MFTKPDSLLCASLVIPLSVALPEGNIMPVNNSRWVRRRENAIFTGVSAGLARQFDVEPWIIRMFWVMAALVTFGGAILLYLACAISFPREEQVEVTPRKMILGVCARIHERGDMEVGLARLLALTLLFITGGAALVGYIVLHFVLTPQNSQNKGTLDRQP